MESSDKLRQALSVAQASLKLAILLFQLPAGWDYMLKIQCVGVCVCGCVCVVMYVFMCICEAQGQCWLSSLFLSTLCFPILIFEAKSFLVGLWAAVNVPVSTPALHGWNYRQAQWKAFGRCRGSEFRTSGSTTLDWPSHLRGHSDLFTIDWSHKNRIKWLADVLLW